MHRVPFEEHWAHSHSCLEACCWQNTHLLLMRIPLKRGTALHEVLLFPRSSLHTLINWCWKWRLAPLFKLWRAISALNLLWGELMTLRGDQSWNSPYIQFYFPHSLTAGVSQSIVQKSLLGKSSYQLSISQFLTEKYII